MGHGGLRRRKPRLDTASLISGLQADPVRTAPRKGPRGSTCSARQKLAEVEQVGDDTRAEKLPGVLFPASHPRGFSSSELLEKGNPPPRSPSVGPGSSSGLPWISAGLSLVTSQNSEVQY